MAYTFSIDTEAEVVRERWYGTISLAELRASCRAEWAHPDYRAGFDMISDFREATTDMTADEVLQFASWFSGEDTPRKHAIIVAKENGLDLASMFSMIRDSVPERDKSTRLFFSAVAAEAWIALDRIPKAQPVHSLG